MYLEIAFVIFLVMLVSILAYIAFYARRSQKQHLAVTTPSSVQKCLYTLYTQFRAYVFNWNEQHFQFLCQLLKRKPDEIYTDLVMKCNDSPSYFLHFERFRCYY